MILSYLVLSGSLVLAVHSNYNLSSGTSVLPTNSDNHCSTMEFPLTVDSCPTLSHLLITLKYWPPCFPLSLTSMTVRLLRGCLSKPLPLLSDIMRLFGLFCYKLLWNAYWHLILTISQAQKIQHVKTLSLWLPT